MFGMHMQLSSVVCTALFLPILLAADFFSLTHPTYSGKVLQATPTASLLLFDFTTTQAPWKIERSMLDSKCRWKCFTQETTTCRTFQTYWTTKGSFYCDLFNITLCDACSVLVNQSAALLESRVWEVKRQEDPDAAKPCAEYSDWMVKGNCSLCGKIGYYGRNCSLRSSCASYYYDPGSPRLIDTAFYTTISPCFTQGKAIPTRCRGPYNFWFQSGDIIQQWWTGVRISYATFLSGLREQLKQSSIGFGAVKRNLFIKLVKIGEWIPFYYSGFSINSEGSLTLGNVTAGRSDGLQAPISDAPLLEPMSLSCGPMWLIDPSVPHNATHIDSCKAPTNVLGISPKWAKGAIQHIIVYVDIDYFQCN